MDQENGEIELLDAERLDDQAGQVALDQNRPSFGNTDDDQAINRMIDKLRNTPTGAKMTDDSLTDKAADLYNTICERIRTGKATSAQITQAAAMFGEAPAKLRSRLSDGGNKSNRSSGLLNALRSEE